MRAQLSIGVRGVRMGGRGVYEGMGGARWEYRARCCSKRTSPRSAKSFRVMPFSELVRIKESINRAVQNNIRSFLVSLDSAHLAR